MIPQRLEIQNFLSYAGPITLDFTRFDIASLIGNNGSGKSALLDALTYGMFGRARGCEGGQNLERLIRDGTDEMYVDFTFSLEGNTYRIVRNRIRKDDTSRGEVRFLVADGEVWKNRAADTASETDDRIASTLRMDYRTFTASAFFVQGRSDDFLRMTPGDRREVFSQLLDLETYERLADVARLKQREAEARRTERAAAVEKLASARDDERVTAAALAEADRLAVEAEEAATASKTGVEALRADLVALERSQAALEAERSQLEAGKVSLIQAETAIATKRAQIDEIDGLLAQGAEAEAAVAEAAELRIKDEALGERKAAQAGYDALVARRVQLEREAAELDGFATKLASVEQTLAEHGDPKAFVSDINVSIAANQATIARLTEQARNIDERITETAEKVSHLSAGEGECPVCGTSLDAAHRKTVQATLHEQTKTLTAQRSEILNEGVTTKKEAKRLAEELKRATTTVADHEKLLATAEQLRTRVLRREEIAPETTSVASELLSLQRTWGHGPIYDERTHVDLRKRLTELQAFEALLGRIAAAGEQRTTLAEEITEMTSRCVTLTSALEERREVIATLTEQVRPLPALRERIAEADAIAASAQRTAMKVAQESATLAERLQTAKRAVADLDAAEDAERSEALTKRRYQRLAEAFGRNGIPQRIIENERPFLEDETNRILGRLSEEPMAVQFRFQGKTKSGKDRETLAIDVRPLDGEPRDFAMFSGGEAFRVAFAVRLAMSKLLVRRAGARLETLVIDEGFGTQDPEGRERLVEAITLAREEFRKVLVITHLDDLKDRFGVQILVTKSTDGSQLEICGG